MSARSSVAMMPCRLATTMANAAGNFRLTQLRVTVNSARLPSIRYSQLCDELADKESHDSSDSTE